MISFNIINIDVVKVEWVTFHRAKKIQEEGSCQHPPRLNPAIQHDVPGFRDWLALLAVDHR
jgi:hypothetical protein